MQNTCDAIISDLEKAFDIVIFHIEFIILLIPNVH